MFQRGSWNSQERFRRSEEVLGGIMGFSGVSGGLNGLQQSLGPGDSSYY